MKRSLILKIVLYVLIPSLFVLLSRFAIFAQENAPLPEAKTAPPSSPPQAATTQAQAPDKGPPQVQAPANAPSGSPSQAQGPQTPPRFPPPRVLPPAIFIKGKEGNINRVFVEDAQVGKEVRVEFIMFDIDPNEKLSAPKTYGLPQQATFKVETMEVEKNRAAAVLTWTPAESDIGIKAFAIEVANSKGEPNRVALFYNVKK